MKDIGYRKATAIMLLNGENKVWVGQRLDNSLDAWQMPQGGLDKGEAPLDGAYRELEEETGIKRKHAELIAQAPEELLYDLPPELVGKVWKEPWKGQRQTWFLMRFTGTDADVNIATNDPEFRAWKWVEPAALPGMIVPFKKKLYEDVLEAFAAWL